MSCDRRHLKTIVNVLDRMGAAFEARRQLGDRADPGLTSAINSLCDEHAQARSGLATCPECSSTWNALLSKP